MSVSLLTKNPEQLTLPILAEPKDKSVTKKNDSRISRIFWKTLEDLKGFIRIDRTARKFYYDPTFKNAAFLGLHVFLLVAIGYLAAATSVPSTAGSVIIGSLFRNIIQESSRKDSKKTSPSPQYFQLSSALPHLALGVASWLVMGPAVGFVFNNLVSFMEGRGFQFTAEQDAITLIKEPGIAGIIFSLYASIGAPILEEYIFRGNLQDGLFGSSKADSWGKMMSILKTSLFFGLVHASPSQGWLNIPIIAATGLMGIFFGILKEVTGDLWAPIGLHAAHNSLVVLQLRNLI